MKKYLIGWLCVAALAGVARGAEGLQGRNELQDKWGLQDGDNIVLIGDSITEQGYRRPWGYYHVLTNAAGEVAEAGGPKVNFIPLGYSGYQVKGWSNMERDSVTNTNVWTWYRNPGWNLKEVFDGKVDVIVIFLGMNDILQPSMHDTDEDRAKWLADYKTFVNNLRERCHPRQFVFATITPLTADPFSPKNIIRRKLNEMLAEYAADTKDAECCDFGAAVESVIDMFKQLDHQVQPVPDFVHPRKYGHWRIARDLALLALRDLVPGVCDHQNQGLDFPKRKLNAWLTLPRVNLTSDDDYVYRIDGIQWFRKGYSLNNEEIEVEMPQRPEVRLELPDGWIADRSTQLNDRFFEFLVRGKPEKALNPVTVIASFRGKELARETINIPAPWKLSEDGGEWKVYTATEDYTGGQNPGSIDPFQCFFGWQTNSLKAARRVWSEKDRDVKAVLSHQGFSETLDLTVALDGTEVWKDDLNRNGKNRIEKTLHLKKGWNALEITCVHHSWQRQFAFDFEPLDGDDLSDLRYGL